MAESQRLQSLDVLRTVAVALVIFDHWGLAYPDHAVGRRAVATGWVGVDLFFVLSGFLVSGLIFREHQRHGTIDARRFLIRRGLKIYPAFYVFLLVSVLFADEWLFGHESLNVAASRDSFGWRVVAEALFLQNYVDGLWTHTWTLAVEEHFYLLLAVCAGIALRHGWTPRNSRRVVATGAAVLAVCLLLRIGQAQVVGYEWKRWYAPTHVRIDSLLVGVVLSYLYHYEWAPVERFFRRYRSALTVVSVLLLLPVVVLERSRKLMYVFGLTSVAIGFGLLIVLMLTSPGIATQRLVRRRTVLVLGLSLARGGHHHDRPRRPGDIDVAPPGGGPGAVVRGRRRDRQVGGGSGAAPARPNLPIAQWRARYAHAHVEGGQNA